MRPPRAAEALLLALAGDAEADFVAGDLAEDFGLLFAERGPGAARRWYLKQVVRSAPSLIGLRMRSGELTGAVLRATLGVLLPLVALDRLWRFVYSHIPLKDGVDRAPGLLMLNVLIVLLCSRAAMVTDRPHRSVPEIMAALLAAVLAMYAGVGAAPWLYVIAVLLAAQAGTISNLWRRRVR